MLIGVDWGTSRLRAYLLDGDGAVLKRTESGAGLMAVEDDAFEATLARAVAPLRESAPDAPILMSGMVGAREGWVEAPYVPVPTPLAALGALVVTVESGLGDVAIVPGLAIDPRRRATAGEQTSGGRPTDRDRGDVMRGEETELLGATVALGASDGTFVLPGSHSKWVELHDGVVRDFRTVLSGELFEAISGHTILRKVLADASDDVPEAVLQRAFCQGIDDGARTSATELLGTLFTIRVDVLFGTFWQGDAATQRAQAREYLSGLLIGAETDGVGAGETVTVVGAGPLAGRYERALRRRGAKPQRAPDECVVLGLFAINASRG